MQKLLSRLKLTASPDLDPVIALAAEVQAYRKEHLGRGGKVTRTTLLYALGRVHAEIRNAVFPDTGTWQRFVSDIGLESFETGSRGDVGSEHGDVGSESS